MFFGETCRKMDEKGRVKIPKKLRKEFKKSRIFITKGPDGCLLLSQKKKDSIERKMKKNGMILILKPLRVHAGLHKDIVFVGYKRNIEIWSPENWVQEKRKWIKDGLEKRWKIIFLKLLTE